MTMPRRRVAIFAHYAPQSKIADYVKYYLAALKSIADELIVISTAPLNLALEMELNNLATQVIVRENIGHDFYSYKIGIEAVGKLADLEYLILCNDSCFGPLFNLAEVFKQMQQPAIDVWGMTSCARPSLHLQSYFMVFKQKTLSHATFTQFWQQVTQLVDKNQIVMNYEVGLSRKLLAAGLKLASVVPQKDYSLASYTLWQRKWLIFSKEARFSNSRFSWKNLFEPLSRIDKSISLYDYSLQYYKLPLIKKSLFQDHWLSFAEITSQIGRYSDYPLELLVEFKND